MRRYELMLLLRPDLEDDKLQAAVEKVTRAIVNGGGSLSKVSPWGKRRLAYDIDRHREASYFLIHFDIEPGQVREIERGLLISDEILRHLVTLIEDRGPVDEVPPAAVARSIEPGEGDVDGEHAAEGETESAPATVADAEPQTEVTASESEGAADADVAAGRSETATDIDDETDAESADAVVTAGERAEG
jgi:small subunit ribosomal protein S6